MPHTHPLATKANRVLETNAPSVYALLSGRGREYYFPVTGILSQGADADGTEINGSIGIALGDDLEPMRLSDIAKSIDLPPRQAFPYAGAYGIKTLREEWQASMKRKNPSMTFETSLPVVTAGLTHGLSIVGALFLEAGDHVHLPYPFWDNYAMTFETGYGAELETFPLYEGEKFNVAGLKQALKQEKGKKILFLNFPNNPTGYAPRKNEAKEIAEAVCDIAAQGSDILVIIDDAYFGFVFEDDVYPESLFSLFGNLHERVLAVKIDGCTKEDYAWGLRVGFITFAGKGLTQAALDVLGDKAAGVVRGTVSNASNASQHLLLKAMRSPNYQKDKRAGFDTMHVRYQKITAILRQPKFQTHMKLLPCNAGYFLCLELREGLDAEKIRQKLLKEYSTGVIALDRFLRIAFSSVPEAPIEELCERVLKACEDEM
ncbi:hypothetical protein A2635_05165 [Candidatus Peribacteria bacterium RIFCSPHIGHO2_01_FULL_51_9]|nr:MAG: hypothetical protein A2635_05165 [Candidatus Peribacteria bacterium RIFCSPHIGHO2_01_FULL_51_9]